MLNCSIHLVHLCNVQSPVALQQLKSKDSLVVMWHRGFTFHLLNLSGSSPGSVSSGRRGELRVADCLSTDKASGGEGLVGEWIPLWQIRQRSPPSFAWRLLRQPAGKKDVISKCQHIMQAYRIMTTEGHYRGKRILIYPSALHCVSLDKITFTQKFCAKCRPF